MLISKATSPCVRIVVYKNPLDSNIPLIIRLSTKEANGRFNFVSINDQQVKLDWDSELGSGQKDRINSIDKLRKKGKFDDALKRGYYLIGDSIRTSDSYKQISAKLLTKTLLNLSRVYQNTQNWREAQKYSAFVAELDPNNLHAHLSAAISLRDNCDEGGIYESFPYAEEAVSLHPNNISARNTLAITYKQVRLAELALEHAEYALELERIKPHNERHASSYITLATILMDLAFKHSQLEDLEKADIYYRWTAGVLNLGEKELQAYEYTNFKKLRDAHLDNLSPKVRGKYFQWAA